ncbi:MAG: PAS domain S-box protein [Alphaproteobacteria bacterium]|nr:PAS domain S-box protein [Alphaproteobacteria bacterium]
MSDGARASADNGDTERLFRATFEQAAVGMAHVGLDGAWLRVNDKVCEIVGYSRDELLGLTFGVITHPDDLESDLAQAARLLAGEIPTYSIEKRYVRKDGTIVWVKLTVALLHGGDGKPRHYISVIEDIAAQKQAALALRASEARFRAAVQAVDGVLWTSNPAGEMVGEQPGWTALTGQSLAEYQGFGWSRAIHPDDAQLTLDAWQMAVGEQRPFVFEHRLRRADGEWRLFSVRAIPIQSEGGGVLEWVGVHTDVTQDRQDEAELFDSRERLGSIISQAAVGIAQTDTTGQFLFVNERQCAILGRSRPEVLAARMFDFAHPDEQSENVARFARLIETGEPFAIEHRIIRPDGAAVWANSHVSLVRDRAGRPLYVIAVVQDINERKYAEAALHQLTHRLENRVTEESAKRELAQAQLIQAQRLEAIGKLTGGVAHDFNNLLQVISANLELLRPLVETAGSKAKTRHDAAGEAVRRGALLTRQLLAFARKQALEPRVLNLGRLVRETAELLRRTLGERIEVEAVANGGLWNTFADPGQLENALINLAVNARDAMPDGGRLTLEVSNAFLDDRYAAAHEEVTSGQYACIAMSDTGTGMDAATIAHAFEPFFTTKPEGHGTGLGLAQVYGFAKQSGGHVKIYSELGQGTTIRLYCLAIVGRRRSKWCQMQAPPPAGPRPSWW